MFRIAIIGATGYVGTEIVRLLVQHPEAEISAVASRSFAGQSFSDVYPNLKNIFNLSLSGLELDEICENADIVITALPHDASRDVIPELIKRGKRVIDHSAAFRFRDKTVYESWYKTNHGMEELLDKAVYGLPEIYREKIATSVLVANPGCYPTCTVLALAPLVKNKLVQLDSIIVDAASGMSGAGRKSELAYSFCEIDENFKAYGVTNHRHTPEIEQELSALAGEKVVISFTPHLVPMKRGMMCTSYLKLTHSNWSAESLYELYREYYNGEFFVRVLEPGILPETKNVSGSNFVDISVNYDKRTNRAIVISALDNLGKGAAGQAVQCMNIMLGLDETTGLCSPAFYL
ncbi:N-acetyl-gamma-glutamyl-phosphate reductase [Thermoclostridium stercorarium subsp. leptospartum DSM 9219]|uniref:N-acetyl-gamma-glutamyl-phosphate reductase n=1 Tax=Thermoclostridium stercorarium subsp. leptospartum DSM 9219 TaxID=1346611 RepID=A0A1B1YNZ6_THEST|nr:N-acetyl-gamma-glutamyl-phosphate reductase [Thermoclostridium stercorarium]ANX02490.1 N-acetyl-gamma-glutamyl-phosphate reductase [Thermoclostridium stercorarium subsp. leptospartum DSM 9219]